MNPSGNTILITGGSGGIGAALAHRFHDAGNAVIITGRRRAALDAVAAGRAGIAAYDLDMADPAAIADFGRRAVADHPALNVLVNNAGIMRLEALDRSRDLADAEETVATNLLGPIRMTNALVDHLAARRGAAVINVSSGLAFVPLVDTPTYSATKAAVHAYTVALRDALKGKVEVLELAPPAVQTELTPGQSTRAGYMPLDAFIDEVMALLARQPTPPEILVERVGFLRFAERDGRFDQTFAQLNAMARQARNA